VGLNNAALNVGASRSLRKIQMLRYCFLAFRATVDGTPKLDKLLRYYIWSILIAVGIGAILIGVAVATPFGPSLRWILEILVDWIGLPVWLAEYVADVVVAPEDPYGPQTAAWSHAFVLAELPWAAFWLYASFRMYRSGRKAPALLAFILPAIYLDAVTFICYSEVTLYHSAVT
jgi:hypothetical protein